ncbi:MAG: hypothetical protein DRQ88_01960 [Epsilonproteobacteria bacterium]|nr:MAG: hypothetical protein DRQ89_00705 [Campylobacterota bacterium]RLA67628.1 MAG: hypothetical protein DRQ88_01960 [Campylobacterota bacterium]
MGGILPLPPVFVGTWSPISSAPILGRAGAIAHWANGEMLVWGGEGQLGSFGDGALYDPDTDSWRLMESTNAPSPRTDLFNLRNTFSNNQLLIWGGRSTAFVNLYDGRLFDLATNTWSTLKAIPDGKSFAGRAYLNGVFNGTEFLLWGGNDSADDFSNSYDFAASEPAYGSRFDSVNDTWSAMSNLGAPSNRKHSVVVWTGTEMIIWSGCYDDCNLYLTDGFSYSGDTWSPISTVDAPSPRKFAFYIWTGSELIIWGGIGDGEVPLKDGAIYNPVTDSWRSISSFRAPTARANTSTALWTGSHFIIFGGMAPKNGSFEFFNDGGVYDPVTDTWVPMPVTAYLPLSGLSKQQMVFTGDSILLWSGWNGTSAYSALGAKLQLDPAFYP